MCRFAELRPTFRSGDSKRFAKLNGENLRYDHPQRGWFVYRDHHWRPDTDGAVDRLALDTIQATTAGGCR